VLDTFQALAATMLALLPGGLYTWAYERQAGAWGVGLSDRLVRFLGASAIFHALTASVTYELYRYFVHSGRLARGEELPTWAWLLPVLYVGLPIAAGSVVGAATRGREPWALLLTGPSPAPRAWDHLFSTGDLEGWVRLRLKNDTWIVGAYATEDQGKLRSYASGYPEIQDLFLVETVECDADGTMLVDEEQNPRLRGVAVLVRWDEVSYLEFIEA
jgi:hypothetical protein